MVEIVNWATFSSELYIYAFLKNGVKKVLLKESHDCFKSCRGNSKHGDIKGHGEMRIKLKIMICMAENKPFTLLRTYYHYGEALGVSCCGNIFLRGNSHSLEDKWG